MTDKTDYRLLSFRGDDDRVRAGILVGDTIYDLATLATLDCTNPVQGDSLLALFENWTSNESALRELTARLRDQPVEGTSLSEVTIETPIQFPQALYCAGANYVDHIEEMTGKTPNKAEMSPFFFLKPPRPTLVAHESAVRKPDYTQQLDWEAEIALVIGRETRNADIDLAMDSVAGLTILNDLSARDLMKRYDVPFLFDWIGQKCFPGAAPIGPWITPIEFVSDPSNLDIRLWVNDRLYQDSNSSQMIFSHAELIANLSRHVTLYPGDVIATGTPAGVGHGRGEYLEQGDVVRVEIGELGSLTTLID